MIFTKISKHNYTGVEIKTVTNTSARLNEQVTEYAKHPKSDEWFVCRFDSHGNICDANGLVIYSSHSGRYPAKPGDKGYFGEFRENYGKGVRPDLPSVHDDVYHING